MATTALWVSAVALAVSIGSLLWQVGRYRLEGPRLKVVLSLAYWMTTGGEPARSATISVQNRGRFGVLVESVVLVGPPGEFGSLEEPEEVWHGGDLTRDGAYWLGGQSAIVVERSLSDAETWLRQNAESCCAVFAVCSTSTGQQRYSRPVLVWSDVKPPTMEGRAMSGWALRYRLGQAMVWWGRRREGRALRRGG